MKRSITLLALLSAVAACTAPVTDGPRPTRSPVPSAAPVVSEPNTPTGVFAALEPAGSCDVLLDYFIEQGLEQVGPWGLDVPGVRWLAMETAADGAAGDDSGGSAEPSSTNVQVEGVDEGDIVKASDDTLFVISNQRLLTFSTAGGGIEKLATLELSRGAGVGEMLLDGDRLAVVTAGFDYPVLPVDRAASDFAPGGSALTEVTLIDVADPSDPTVIADMTVDGSVVTTRLVEGHLRLVLEAHPVGLSWSYPDGSGLRAERAATERNREVVRRSTIENWLPYYVADSGDEGTLLDCADVLLPPEPSGLGTLSILDFDLSAGIGSWDAASVVASGSTVYANQERTYVATQRWIDQRNIDSDEVFAGHVTRIHRFDTPVDGEMTYVASGDVDGFLRNQFAMDEYEGNLRVASTSAPDWWGRGEDSESQVTVLSVDGDRLQIVGSVGGLGVTETIQAVRFMGPVGYVVTFRQTDPLYVIDLSDPTDPRAAGELKIPGFSTYLHPVADGRLLGVGQDADPETGAALGLQISLFDISDPASPTRLDTFSPKPVTEATEGHVGSPAEWDHKAFTFAGTNAYVPFEGWSWSEKRESLFLGLLAIDWSGDSLDGTRMLSIFEGKPDGSQWVLMPQRTVVKGDVAYAVGHEGLTAIDLPSGEVVDQLRY